tara:strand:- start:4516 stop:5163 length:648 start_codon:yes stop_codon:yes gene_type:complete
MKLITEVNENVEVLVEEDKNGKKNLFISGPFMMSEVKNKNGRMYPKDVLMKEVKRYSTDYVDKNRAFGELGHPDGPGINLERVSHIITELKEDGNNVMGKAKIMDTPYGTIVKNLLDNGAQLGVSSRGMGSLEEKNGVKVVKDDFYLATAADIVADPSAPEAFVQGIMEGKEWIWESGTLVEAQLDEIKKEITTATSINLDNKKIKAFSQFLSKL